MRRLRVGVLAAFALLATPAVARAEWVRDSVSIAWKSKGATLWRFSYDPASGKPFFNPIALIGNPSLTNFKPEDHPWHYGLWFSWKYINHVNYWEENRVSGQAAGSTRWATPVVDARADGSARITMNLTYARSTGEVDMTEARVLTISAPQADDSFTIDWDLRFTAGKDGAALDRTPMPGEPNGAANGEAPWYIINQERDRASRARRLRAGSRSSGSGCHVRAMRRSSRTR